MRRAPSIAIAIACIVLAGILPTPWMAGVTRDISSVLWVPLSPLSHGATAVRVWLRPATSGVPEADNGLVEECGRLRGRLHAEYLKVEELERRLAEFQSVVRSGKGAGKDLLEHADVLSRTAAAGGVALKLNVGKRRGVAAGDIAVVRGDVIVGRVASEVGELGCFVTSLASKGTPRMDCYIVPASEERSAKPRTQKIQLAPDGGGALVGDIDLNSAIGVGDTVRLSDPSWPPGAQGMLVGKVIELRRKESQPLRGEVIVGPAAEVDRIGSVVIKIQSEIVR